MPIQFSANVTCDGCGRPIQVEETVLPVIMQDEERNDIYLCSHLCLHPYADRRHPDRLEKITRHLEGNVDQITANLADAKSRAADGDQAAESEAATIEPFLAEAEDALTKWTEVRS